MARKVSYKGYTIKSSPYKLADPPGGYSVNRWIELDGETQSEFRKIGNDSIHNNEDDADDELIHGAKKFIDDKLL